jgi:hypothetical protein
MDQSHGFLPLVKVMLLVAAMLAFFLGLFDLTIYSDITGYFGTEGGVVFLATVLSTLPSIAGYLALKEGVFRKFGSLKGFDKLVYGNVAWLLFGILFFLLAASLSFSSTPILAGAMAVLLMQLILGFAYFASTTKTKSIGACTYYVSVLRSYP